MTFCEFLSRSVGDGRIDICLIDFSLIRLGIFERGFIRVGVGIIHQRQPVGIALQQIVEPRIRGIGVRRGWGHRHAVVENDRAFRREDVLELRRFLCGEEGFAVPDNTEVHVTRHERSLRAVAVEDADVRHQFE